MGSSGSPVSSTYKTDRHDITEILLKVALSTIKPTNQPCCYSKIILSCTQYTNVLKIRLSRRGQLFKNFNFFLSQPLRYRYLIEFDRGHITPVINKVAHGHGTYSPCNKVPQGHGTYSPCNK